MGSRFSEITIIPVLVEQLDVADAIISINAMGTQVAIAQQIYRAKTDYILALKGNHPTLSRAATDWFFSYTQLTATVSKEGKYSYTESGYHRLVRTESVLLRFPSCSCG